jgi:hypothetical protein
MTAAAPRPDAAALIKRRLPTKVHPPIEGCLGWAYDSGLGRNTGGSS